MTATNERDAILQALRDFAEQRPGLEFGNYGDVTSYRAESRAITRDLHHARQLLAAVMWRDSIGADELEAQLSGRLTWHGPEGLAYCTGQYFPVEYRAAVCRALASALWAYWRVNLGPDCTGHDIRREARRQLGASLARRWFN